MAIYILQKDLPDAKSGDKYVKQKDGNYYNWSRISSFWNPAKVENNPNWFKIKEEEKIKVTGLYNSLDNRIAPKGMAFTFVLDKEITENIISDNYSLIIKSIEFILNNNVDENKIPDKIQDILSEDIFDMPKRLIYTEEDMRKCFLMSRETGIGNMCATYSYTHFEDILKSLNK